MMKKQRLLTLAIVICLFVCLFTACSNTSNSGGGKPNNSGGTPDCTHTSTRWITDEEATCTTDGSKHKECSSCGKTLDTESISAKGHDYYELVVPSTEEKQGYTLHQCSRCNDSYKDNFVELSTFTIHFNSMGGSEIADIELSEGDTFVLPDEPTKKGFFFEGWYDNASYLGNNISTLDSINSDLTLYAKWNNVYKRINKDGSFNENGEYILFGQYPQSKVEDESILAELNRSITALPTENSFNGWTSYNYRIYGYMYSPEYSDYMFYIDKTIDGEQYRGVYFLRYRPTRVVESNYSKYLQEINGYYKETVYWFKYEPIKWRILEDLNEELFLFCETILDSRSYSDKFDGNWLLDESYSECALREWLNNDFYELSFSDDQKSYVKTTYVDNSNIYKKILSSDPITYDKNTQDKVFLLSTEEVNDTRYGFNDSMVGMMRDENGSIMRDEDGNVMYSGGDANKYKEISDYALCQGLSNGTPRYWLRSGAGVNWGNDVTHAATVRACLRDYYQYGEFDGDISSTRYLEGSENCDIGVVPAIKIQI